MTSRDRHVTLFHAPNSRSAGALILLEELGADYELHVLDLKKGEQREAPYLAVNPMGKVPAILHDGALVTEQGAVYLYLADLYPEAGLTPAIGDPLRGPFLRWLFFYGSSFEPAIVDQAMKREAAAQATSPYGTWPSMLSTLTGQLGPGPYLFGDRFTAADVLWGSALRWTTMFKLVPESAAVTDYVARVAARPAAQRAAARDAALAATQSG